MQLGLKHEAFSSSRGAACAELPVDSGLCEKSARSTKGQGENDILFLFFFFLCNLATALFFFFFFNL